MGFFSYFAAREIGRAMSAGERREMAKFRRDMEKSNAAMALSAEKFLNKVRYRSILGHPEFLQNEPAQPQRWWDRIEHWTDFAFDRVVQSLFSLVSFLAVLVTLYAIDEKWLNAFTMVLAFAGVVILTHELFNSHLWRPVVRWINWKFRRQGWPVEQMLVDLKRDEEAERLAGERATEMVNSPLRPVKYQSGKPTQVAASLGRDAPTEGRSLRQLVDIIGDLVDEAETDDSLDAQTFAARAAELAGLVSSFGPLEEEQQEAPAEWREISNVVTDVADAAAQILTLRERDVSHLVRLLLVLSVLLGEVVEQR